MSNNNSHSIIPQLILGIVTPTMMITKVSGEKIIDLLEDMGKASEEIFRGERLPILKDHDREDS